MVDSWKETGAEVHKWLKNCAVSAPSIIASHKDGSTTTNYNEVMKILFDAWMPIFKQYAPAQAPKRFRLALPHVLKLRFPHLAE